VPPARQPRRRWRAALALLPPQQARPFRGIRYISSEDGGRTVAEGQFPDGVGIGIRRTVLHGVLARRAEELGAVLHWGARATGLSPDGPLVGSDVLDEEELEGALGVKEGEGGDDGTGESGLAGAGGAGDEDVGDVGGGEAEEAADRKDTRFLIISHP